MPTASRPYRMSLFSSHRTYSISFCSCHSSRPNDGAKSRTFHGNKDMGSRPPGPCKGNPLHNPGGMRADKKCWMTTRAFRLLRTGRDRQHSNWAPIENHWEPVEMAGDARMQPRHLHQEEWLAGQLLPQRHHSPVRLLLRLHSHSRIQCPHLRHCCPAFLFLRRTHPRQI